MSESEIQPLFTFVRCSAKVLLLLLHRHCGPLLLLPHVPPDVPETNTPEEEEVQDGGTQQEFISAVVVRFVVFTVNVGTDDDTALCRQVVQGGGDGTGTN